MKIPAYHPAELASFIDEDKADRLPRHLVCQCKDRFSAAVLSSKLNGLGFTVTISEDHCLEARGPQPSTVGGDWTVPS